MTNCQYKTNSLHLKLQTPPSSSFFDIPSFHRKVRGDIEWFFFSKLDKKYETGVRVNRSTKLGFWKVTGPEYKIKYGSRVIGEKRFLVYYNGHSKMGKRTDWVLHEYRLTDATLPVTQGKEVYAVYRLFWKGNSDPISGGPAPADAVEGGEQVHGDDVAPASAAFQVVEELGPDGKNTETTPADEAPEAAPNALALVIHNEAPPETLDLVTHCYHKRPYEHSKGTSSAREDTRACPVKRPRLAEPDSPQNLSPRGQEPNSSNSAAGAIPSLTLSLACPASETAPKQQEQRLIVAPQPVPRQAVKPPPWTTSVQILPKIRLTIERSGKRGTPKDRCAKDV
ncbi:NAC domain-containing protein 78 [Eucalyptus grandis]|uniref:NAC domain-containing protein 78 n=1 Tax=Eucalyptus grandis TaxID=71139 RepID=UPI00192EC3AD|nr:NAC domain-containing protein 78 [Eucalyptus grandis]